MCTENGEIKMESPKSAHTCKKSLSEMAIRFPKANLVDNVTQSLRNINKVHRKWGHCV